MMAMPATSVKNLLSGAVAEGTTVTARGWVRSRRDSKAGISLSLIHI